MTQAVTTGDRSALSGAGAAHDRPNIDQLFSPGHVVTVVHIGAHIQIRRIQFDALPELEIPLAVLPNEDAVFGSLVLNLHFRTSFYLIGGPQQRLVASIDGALVWVPLADHRGHDRQRHAEIRVSAWIAFAADVAVERIHKDERAGLKLGQSLDLRIDVVGSRAATGNDL